MMAIGQSQSFLLKNVWAALVQKDYINIKISLQIRKKLFLSTVAWEELAEIFAY